MVRLFRNRVIRRRVPMWSAVVVVAGIVAGCTSVSSGSPRPDPGYENGSGQSSSAPSTKTSTRDLPYAGAPRVESPLDTELFEQDPCQSLTSDQADKLGLRFPGEFEDDALGNACEFRVRTDRLALVEVASLDKYPYGVSAVYQADKDGKLELFEPLGSIEGYPAVVYGSLDSRDIGICSVVIGLSDEIAFEIALQQSAKNVGKKDPCEVAALVTGMVVQTMKAAQ
jgi:hypothetical protein